MEESVKWNELKDKVVNSIVRAEMLGQIERAEAFKSVLDQMDKLDEKYFK